MNKKEEILHFLTQNKQELLSRFYLSKIGLFGSFSRDEAQVDSDVDIIVDFKEPVKDIYSVKIALKKYLSKKLGREVDIAREKYLKPYIKEQIQKDTIYV